MKYIHTVVCTIVVMVATHSIGWGQTLRHSILRENEWIKIEIAKSGVYKIKASDLNSLQGVGIARIGMYGWEGGKLSEVNGEERPDDLREMAIEIKDENGNGVFDGRDYILFYATGSYRWSYDSTMQRYVCTSHPYSNANYVYLTQSEGVHQRISRAELMAEGESTIEYVHVVGRHEIDKVNTHESGQIWVGERFYGGATQSSIRMTLPSVPVGSIKASYAFVSLSTSSATLKVDLEQSERIHNFSRVTPYQTFYETFDATQSKDLDFNLTYQPTESMATGYLDYITVDATVGLRIGEGQQSFYVPRTTGAATRHHIHEIPTNVRIWDITNYNAVVERSVEQYSGSKYFVSSTDSNRTYIAFSDADALLPVSIKSIDNQDLHGSENPDMVIVYHPTLRTQAERLAAIHSIHDDMGVLAVSQEEVFNEFSSGQTDPIAIRELLRMYWKRAMADSTLTSPRYLILFGKGSYDNRNILNNSLPTVVTYQTPTSFDDDGASYGSDDTFGYLEDGEIGRSNETMEVSIGRLPAKNIGEAQHLVDKIEQYLNRSDMMQDAIRGDWRNSIALLADDADPSSPGDTIFTNSQERTARRVVEKYPQYNIDKIYSDAYVQQSGADGSYYPEVNNAIKKRMDYGCILLNYIGHGSAQYIGTERYMQKSDIDRYQNTHQLPFFVTSTCTFGRYDGVETTCGAEDFVLADGGGIGCVAASRPISHVQTINTEMVMQALDPANSIGDAIRLTKNRYNTPHSITLMGDPAIKLSFPKYKVVVTRINGQEVTEGRMDSALVLSTVTVEGEIRDGAGMRVEDFEGVIYPEVYDREQTMHTLSNDNENCAVSYTTQKSVLYKGCDSVRNGRFRYQFIVPRDVAYKFDRGKLSHYAKSVTEDATGAYNNIVFGGIDESVDLRETRPSIRLYINDTNFRDGGLTNENPTLYAVLYDSIGINAVGSGLGHDITAILDENANALTVLNDFYQADITDARRGVVRYNYSGLESGWHTLTLKAWNIYNYSSSATIRFHVGNSDTVRATAMMVYPNPATESATLRMEYNCPEKVKSVRFDIYDQIGRKVRSYQPEATSESYVAGPVRWDLRMANGQRVNPGIYMIRCVVATEEGEKMTGQSKIVVR